MLVTAAVLVSVAAFTLAIFGSVAALSVPRPVWQESGHRRSLWIWQAVGVLMLPLALVYSGTYFIRIHPHLVAAQRRVLKLTQEGAASQAAVELARQRLGGERKATVRIRQSGHVLLFSVLPVLVQVGFAQAALRRPHPHLLLWLVLAYFSLLILFGYLQWQMGATLTDREIGVRNFRSRHLQWHDIAAITRDQVLGNVRISLWTKAGNRVRLAAPTAGLGLGRKAFDRKLQLITDYWLTFGSDPNGSNVSGS